MNQSFFGLFQKNDNKQVISLSQNITFERVKHFSNNNQKINTISQSQSNSTYLSLTDAETNKLQEMSCQNVNQLDNLQAITQIQHHDKVFKEEQDCSSLLNLISNISVNNKKYIGQYNKYQSIAASLQPKVPQKMSQSELSLCDKAKLDQESQLYDKKLNSNFCFNLLINFRNQITNISVSQVQRRNLLNLIYKNKNKQFNDKLINFTCKQYHSLKFKPKTENKSLLLDQKYFGKEKTFEVKNQILIDKKKLNQIGVQLINQQDIAHYKNCIHNQSDQLNKTSKSQINQNKNQLLQKNCNKAEDSIFSKNISFQYNEQTNANEHIICMKQIQLDEKASLKLSKIINTMNTKNQSIFQSQKNKILGGGICGSKENAYSSKQVYVKQQQELQQNIPQIYNKLQDQTEIVKEKHEKPQLNELERFNMSYEEYFTSKKLNENEIENEVKFIIKKILYPLNDYIGTQEIRDKVIDVINLLINYLLVIIFSKKQSATEKQIIKLNKKLQSLRLYCDENKERFPCLSIYQYCDILIQLNSQRLKLDEVNLGSDSLYLVQKIAQVAKYGAGFVSIKGATKNVSETELIEMKNCFNEIKSIISQNRTQGGTINTIQDIKENNIAQKIYGLFLKKVDVIGDQFLENDGIEEIIFLLEEIINITDNESIIFFYMQLNYLLSKQKKKDGFKELLQRLEKENKTDLIMKQESFVQIEEIYTVEKRRSIANLIAQYNQFRFIRSELLMSFAQILKLSNRTEKQFTSVMITIVSNYFQEKQKAVKIVSEENLIMADFINKQLEKSKIIAEINYSKQQIYQLLDHKQQYNQFAYEINNDRELEIHLTKYSVIAWVQRLKEIQQDLYLNYKDELLIEVNNLYVDQQITYQEGFKINTDEKDALNQIINQFLVPNFVISSDETKQLQNQFDDKNFNQNLQIFQQNDQQEYQQQERRNVNNVQCKILSILAESGCGKSTLLKKLQVELLHRKSCYTKNNKSDFIPIIIKCKQLDRQKPSIEDYLESENLDKNFIEILKKSEKNKLIMLDGFDEYDGEYFQVYQKLKLNEWVNTLVIVTSRLEKIAVTDAQNYFKYYNQYGNQGQSDSFTIVKLEKFTDSDIFEYLQKFEKQKSSEKQQHNQIKQLINRFEQLIELIRTPINLYYLTRMTKDINLNDEAVYFAFQEVSDQIELFELFFQQIFNKKSKIFIQQQKHLNLNENQKHEIIEKIQTCFFEYFQSIAMQIFLQKGQKPNYLSIAKIQIKFQPKEQILEFLQKYQLKTEEINNLFNNFNDPRVVKINYFNQRENKNNLKNENPTQIKFFENEQEFEFRFKSLYEYFAARAMKYDFDLHKEEIFKLDIQQLKQFQINKKVIMNCQSNTSDQQILLNLYKLIKLNLDSLSFKYTYAQQDLSQTNRYIQFLKKSTIQKHTEKSQIDIGASNLLSALFISKFLFVNLTFYKNSFSQAYLPSKKLIKFQDCNLDNAFINKQNLENCETSNTNNALFGDFENLFDTKDIYQFNKVIFYNKTLISITRTGFINQFEITENNSCKILKSIQITTVPLRAIHFVINKNIFVLRGRKSLFEVDAQTFERTNSYTFSYDIANSSINELKYIVTLENKQVFYGDIQNGFILLDQNKIQSEQSLSLNDLIFTYLNNQIHIYSLQNLQFIKTIQNCKIDLNISAFSPDGKYLATAGLKDNFLYIWNVQQGFQLVNTIQGHSDFIFSVAFSSDGKYIATGSKDKTCKIWDAEKGLQLINTIQGHHQTILSVAFSDDGKYLATSSHDQTCKIFNILQGFEFINTIQGHAQTINSVAFSPDGKYLATGSGDNTCRIWSVEKKKFYLLNILQGHKNQINSVAFSADSKYLATGSQDNTCKIWNIERGFQLINTIQDHFSSINSVTFSPDGKYFVTGSSDKSCKIWSVEKGFQLFNIIQGHSQEIKSVAFSGDGQLLATVSSDNTCKIWNSLYGFCFINNIQGHSQPITSVTFSVDGKYLATASEDKTCKIWNLLNNCQILKTIQGHTSKINSVSFSADGKYLATCSEDKTCKIWNTQNEFQMIKSIEGHVLEVNSASFSPNSKYLATGSSDKTCKIWCIEKLYHLNNSIEEQSIFVNQVTFSQDCKYLAACLDNNTCKIWRVDKGFDFLTTIQGHSKAINSVAFSADGKYLATGSSDSTCKIWNAHKRFELLQTIDAEIHHITAVAFSLNGKYLALGSYFACKILDVEKGFEVITKIQENTEKINSVVFSDDSKYFATGSNDKTCKIYTAENYFQLVSTISGHTSFVYSVAFSADGRFLATGSQDKTCKIWNMRQGFEHLITLQGHTFEINSVAFSPDSNFLATGSYDKTCKIWCVNYGFQLIKNIEAHIWIISSLAFSTDGKYLVTGSRDKTCKIWNLEKGFDMVNKNQDNDINSALSQYNMIQSQNNIVQFNGVERMFQLQYEL
ncbi:WD domain, G-beta repeat protein (macronuclear) [Tetrahymena thermophila SB210]|uniref:WD domain, G-beta repeat protein n=1 Tax=Tetrahymena thermophila (strain SB210) TaxID=312017 RepID=Q232S8_TETTS|nr:WD domain, G-beta repeat protein [Tetrahymena thermophila SB210]EAR91526.1 WD domain, G-beta repeat protein [Tetrahymena thermophila SB210]|eukprot:XP_001011771.1 WD domain, G-beta repeat protein [Tetrahymena thermophila SB210]